MSDAEDADIAFSAAEEAEGEEALTISLDAFQGPLHLLLELARAKKLDLARLSVADIADQYLAFIAAARARDLEVAADYLVMASWLALLKSRLLLPAPQRSMDEPSPDDVADALRRKLQHMEEARLAAQRLDAMAQLDRDIFLFGQPQPIKVEHEVKWRASLHDLLSSYCAERAKRVRKRAFRTFVRRAFPLERARKSLEEKLPALQEWSELNALAPAPAETGPEAPPPISYLASTFAAALELAREHKVELRQAEQMEALFVRAKRPNPKQETEAQEE